MNIKQTLMDISLSPFLTLHLFLHCFHRLLPLSSACFFLCLFALQPGVIIIENAFSLLLCWKYFAENGWRRRNLIRGSSKCEVIFSSCNITNNITVIPQLIATYASERKRERETQKVYNTFHYFSFLQGVSISWFMSISGIFKIAQAAN